MQKLKTDLLKINLQLMFIMQIKNYRVKPVYIEEVYRLDNSAYYIAFTFHKISQKPSCPE